MNDEPELDIETSYLVDQALRGVRGTVEQVWRAIAARQLSIYDCQFWVEQVADLVVHQILDAKPSGPERGSRALLALGIEGRQDKLWSLRDDLNGFLAFDDLDNPGRKPDRKEILKYLRQCGHLLNVDDHDAMKRIDRLRVGGN